jgi:hypothetical protein
MMRSDVQAEDEEKKPSQHLNLHIPTLGMA